jgi:hypothetical protein
MLKKSLVFGGIALVAFTLLILVGCPDVVSNDPTAAVQGDLTVSATADGVAGDEIIAITLTSGKFIANLATGTDTTIAQIRENFTIKNGNADFNVGTSPGYKLSIDRKIFTITLGIGADSPTGKKLTVKIPSAAIDPEVKVPQGGAQVATSQQVDIPVRTSIGNATTEHNAIVVTLTTGFFVSEITVADFESADDSAISIGIGSEVELDATGKIATIYGTAVATHAKPVKIGIRKSALVGYPVITPEGVTLSSKKGQGPVTTSYTPTSNADDHIKITLGSGEFADSAVRSHFTLTSGNTSITNGTLTVNAGKKEAVIKLNDAFPISTAVKVKIAKEAFDDDYLVFPTDVTARTTHYIVVEPIATVADKNVLIITINDGEFVTPLDDLSLFTKTGTEVAAFLSVSRDSGTVAKITLDDSMVTAKTLGVTIDVEAFTTVPEPEDIILSLGT